MFSLQIQDMIYVQITNPGYSICYMFSLQIQDMIFFQFTNPAYSIFSVYESRI